MPVTFEQNQGQASPGVKFIARGASGVLYLSPAEITLRAPGQADQFRLKLRGAAGTTSVLGTGASAGIVNYFHGNEPSKWLTNIPSFTQVTYKNVYPQIDLVVYGNNRQFESDFVIAHGADPSAIALQIDGGLAVRRDGSLAIQAAGGAFQLHRPFVYQLASNGERVPVACRYTIGNGNQVGFSIGRYDHSKSLIIDPVLTYSTYLGGNQDDLIIGVTGDILGNIYVTGQTDSSNFPTSNPLQAKYSGTGTILGNGVPGGDCFVSKFDPTGQHLIYSTYLGGSLAEKCIGVAVNLLGEAFVGGTTLSTNFPTTKNAIQPTLVGGVGAQNGFVTHFDCTGSKLIFSTYLGGGGEFLTGLNLDILSNVYVTGSTNSKKFPVTKGSYQTACAGACYDNAFLSKLSDDGSKLIYSTYLGGSNNYDGATGVAVDITGSAYLTGQATSTDFPTKNAYQPKIAGFSSGFVTKFSSDGTSLIYSTFIGGSNFDRASSIAVDLFGNAYITGSTSSPNFPTVNPVQATLNNQSSNAFVSKFNSTGSALVYSTYLGGSVSDAALAISVDLFGNANIIGSTYSPDFPTKSAIQSTYGGSGSAFVASLNTKGALDYSTYFGGNCPTIGFAIYSDLLGNTWIGGQTAPLSPPASPTFPLVKPFQATLSGPTDAFLARITPP